MHIRWESESRNEAYVLSQPNCQFGGGVLDQAPALHGWKCHSWFLRITMLIDTAMFA
jgi:hypothetical protein